MQTLAEMRNRYVREGPSQVGTEYVCVCVCVCVCVVSYTYIYKGVQLKFKLQHTLEPDRSQHGRPAGRLCYCSAVFFRHLSLIAVSFTQAKIRGVFKKFYFFYFFKVAK